jgi:hypothetical protein
MGLAGSPIGIPSRQLHNAAFVATGCEPVLPFLLQMPKISPRLPARSG